MYVYQDGGYLRSMQRNAEVQTTSICIGGVVPNDFVDEQAKSALDLTQPDTVTVSAARSRVVACRRSYASPLAQGRRTFALPCAVTTS